MLFLPGDNATWHGSNDPQNRLFEIEQIAQKLRDAGIRLPEASRFGRYLRSARSMTQSDSSKLPHAQLALNLMTEIREMNLILQELPRSPEVPGWQSKMHTALKGSLLSAEDGADSAGRDAQFELYLASAFRAAGFDVTLDEPDVTFQMDGQTFGIAAKRVKSEKTVEKRIREASKQIERSGNPGIIALDITYLYDSTTLKIVNHLDDVSARGRNIADEFAMDAARRMESGGWLAGDLTFCLMVCVNVRVTIMESLHAILGMPIIAPKPAIGFRWTMMGFPGKEADTIMTRINNIKDRIATVAF